MQFGFLPVLSDERCKYFFTAPLPALINIDYRCK
ncbi:hypothetical protein ABIE06_002298 [Pantoea dispersa]|nr:hypothetical protein [Pantoea dispersa]